MSQKLPYMIEIDPSEIFDEIEARGISRTEAAMRLLPHYENRSDAYHVFRKWMRKKRMPRYVYLGMKELLDGTV